METVTSKWQILQEAGYEYNFDRMVYFNRSARKVFSVEFVEDHSESDLQRCVGEPTTGSAWHFYFNSPPAAAVARELQSVLG